MAEKLALAEAEPGADRGQERLRRMAERQSEFGKTEHGGVLAARPGARQTEGDPHARPGSPLHPPGSATGAGAETEPAKIKEGPRRHEFPWLWPRVGSRS
ncbi:hypothetical protein GCM10011390_33040 [Aureimonas endophytica]|uniref:Uncharacterized protein n=1 Tax=Aureimonas endophytica TaxID=2027858 RepID=A0A916ZT61_9HYPH|nr:hypothetical protein GCM10011390_33040 [Aureimonas endophytica]